MEAIAKPAAAILAVSGLLLPAWIWAAGPEWYVGLAGIPDASGRLRFFAARPLSTRRLLSPQLQTIAIGAFASPGACVEFFRALSLHRGARNHSPRPVAAWRPPAPSFVARPDCSRWGHADPIGMARLGLRLLLESESHAGRGLPGAALARAVGGSPVPVDQATSEFYDAAFAPLVDWILFAVSDPAGAMRVAAGGSRAAEDRRSARVASDDQRLAPVPVSVAPSLASPVRAVLSSAVPPVPLAALDAQMPQATARPRLDAWMTQDRSLSAPDFQPRLASGITVAGIAVHVHEADGPGPRPLSDDPALGLRGVVRTYRTVVSLDPAKF